MILSDEELMKADLPTADSDEKTDVVKTEEDDSIAQEEVEQSEVPSEDKEPVEGDDDSDETVNSVDTDSVTKEKEDKPAAKTQVVNFESDYKKIMAPFKANGRMVELKTPDEAIKLMQMGANFTRKMQEIAPQRKIIAMLQNNDLLDEARISYLIDLDKKNPEAIKKLLKDSEIDPLSIDLDEEVEYQEGRHQVSEAEVTLKSHLEDLRSTPKGQETIQLIHSSWDNPSKELLWENPEIMQAIHAQRESGVYDQIVTEIDRQRLLGGIAANVPFLHAYKQVGDAMFATPTQAKEPVAVRVVAPKPAVANGSKANAASSPRISKSTGNPSNLHALSDDEFLKQMQNRV